MMDREIKVQRAWVEGELEERVLVAQVQPVEGIRSELASELAAVRSWSEECCHADGEVERQVDGGT